MKQVLISSQAALFAIEDLWKEGKVPRVPVFVSDIISFNLNFIRSLVQLLIRVEEPFLGKPEKPSGLV